MQRGDRQAPPRRGPALPVDPLRQLADPRAPRRQQPGEHEQRDAVSGHRGEAHRRDAEQAALDRSSAARPGTPPRRGQEAEASASPALRCRAHPALRPVSPLLFSFLRLSIYIYLPT